MNNRSSPNISVIITIFREGKLLRETVDSTLNQTLQDFEIVFVDNNADLITRDVAKDYVITHPDKIRIVHEPVQGMCAAKNRGILESRGEFIAFIDGDDIMAPNRLSRQKEFLLSNPEISLVTCQYDRISHDARTIIEKDITSPTRQSNMWTDLEIAFAGLYSFRFSPSRMKGFQLTIPSTFFLRKSTLEKAGLFEMRLNPRWCEDYELQTRLFELGGFYQIPESLVLYRTPNHEAKTIKEGQVSGYERFWQDQKFFTILYENFSPFGPEAEKHLKIIRSIWLRGVGLHFITHREGLNIGRTLLKRAIENAPDHLEAKKLYLKSLSPKLLLPKIFWFKEFKSTKWIKEIPDFGERFLPWPPTFTL